MKKAVSPPSSVHHFFSLQVKKPKELQKQRTTFKYASKILISFSPDISVLILRNIRTLHYYNVDLHNFSVDKILSILHSTKKQQNRYTCT